MFTCLRYTLEDWGGLTEIAVSYIFFFYLITIVRYCNFSQTFSNRQILCAILTTVVYDLTRISYYQDGSQTYGATYRMWFRLPVPRRTLNPNPNLNPNPKTDPDPNPNPNPNPKSNNNLCSAKCHPNKVQDSVINISYFVRQGAGM